MVATDDLREAREEKRLKLREVARLAHVDAAHLSRFEKGKAPLSLSALVRLAGVLEIDGLAGVTVDLVRLSVYPPEPDA